MNLSKINAINPFVPNTPFLYRKIFWCIQGVDKGRIGNKCVNTIINNIPNT